MVAKVEKYAGEDECALRKDSLNSWSHEPGSHHQKKETTEPQEKKKMNAVVQTPPVWIRIEYCFCVLCPKPANQWRQSHT
jgi:hypothetical protein